MTTSRFDQVDGEPYGACRDCDGVFSTKEKAHKHMSETHELARRDGGNHGHSVSIRNPERPERIERAIGGIVSDVMDDFCNQVDDLINDEHITEEEATKAMRFYADFQEAWENWPAESRS